MAKHGYSSTKYCQVSVSRESLVWRIYRKSLLGMTHSNFSAAMCLAQRFSHACLITSFEKHVFCLHLFQVLGKDLQLKARLGSVCLIGTSNSLQLEAWLSLNYVTCGHYFNQSPDMRICSKLPCVFRPT